MDLSLEEALLAKAKKENLPSEGIGLPSPKLSRIVVDTSRRLDTHMDPKLATSSLRKHDKEGKIKRGLTVSFVQSDGDKKSLGGVSSSSKKKFTRHRTQRNLDSSITDDLNSSRYGAMERRYSQTRKEGKFPRNYPGDDPRLGYDWIAGLLDASESYLSERDDKYFEEINEFRRINFAECHKHGEVL